MNFSDLVFIDSTGYHYPDFPTIQAWLISEYQGIYGADIYLEADSQDGQFLAVLARAFYDVAALGAATYNSFSPVTAQGLGLARNVKINGISRQSPSFSSVTLTIVGTAGTIINNGIATDFLQQQWLLPTPTVIPGGGTIDVVAMAAIVGAFNADINTITSIFTPTRGWQTVNNAAAATPGAPVESDAGLRIRQTQSVANPSLTVFAGTIGGVENLPGVTKVKGYENDTDSTDANGVPEHSICVVVAGGTDDDIANEIELHKTPGTGTFGDVSVPVVDSKGMPITISFQRAVTATIHVIVTLAAGIGWSSDYETLIAAAVASVINSGGIGDTVLYSRLFAPAYLNGAIQGTTYTIATIEIGKNVTPPASMNIDLDFDENPVCDATTDVTFVVT